MGGCVSRASELDDVEQVPMVESYEVFIDLEAPTKLQAEHHLWLTPAQQLSQDLAASSCADGWEPMTTDGDDTHAPGCKHEQLQALMQERNMLQLRLEAAERVVAEHAEQEQLQLQLLQQKRDGMCPHAFPCQTCAIDDPYSAHLWMPEMKLGSPLPNPVSPAKAKKPAHESPKVRHTPPAECFVASPPPPRACLLAPLIGVRAGTGARWCTAAAAPATWRPPARRRRCRGRRAPSSRRSAVRRCPPAPSAARRPCGSRSPRAASRRSAVRRGCRCRRCRRAPPTSAACWRTSCRRWRPRRRSA
jgi:hypothetical protein